MVSTDKITTAPVFTSNNHSSFTPPTLSTTQPEHILHDSILPTEYIANSSTPKTRWFNHHQLYQLLGFEDLIEVGQKNITIADTGKVPVDISKMARMPTKKWNTNPLEKTNTLGSIVHMDIGYGDCVSVGAFGTPFYLWISQPLKDTFMVWNLSHRKISWRLLINYFRTREGNQHAFTQILIPNSSWANVR